MKKILLYPLYILLLVMGFSAANAQVIDSTLARYAEKYQAEKTYLHFDKAAYAPGETVWFKGYIMKDYLPSEESKNFYVDWVTPNGEVLHHTVSPIVDGATNGQFDIPAGFDGAFIHVRAYTRWMLNFDTAFLFSKDLRIISKGTITKQATGKQASVVSLQFFPEGGDAITGVSNRIAFKANDQWGYPVKVRGVVTDSKGSVIDSFRSVHNGMGMITLQPKEGLTYSARWKDEKGADHTTPLPAVRTSGVGLQVALSGNKRIITLTPSGAADAQPVHLIGTMNQRMAFKTDVPLKAGEPARRIIPTENLPSGILTITLFDASWKALAERITFINNNEYTFQPGFEVQHWGLSKRGRNDLQISIPDSLAGANLSISVTDIGMERDTASNIISSLMLESDIRGTVYNPSYYFKSNSNEVAQHLDLVMMTHGWRRFQWEEIAKGKLPTLTFPKDSSYLYFSGKVYGVAKGQLSGTDNMFLLLKEKDSGTKTLVMPLHTDGTFGDPDLILFDTVKVYYQLKSKFFSNAEARFMTDRLPAPNYTSFSKSLLARNVLGDTAGTYRHMLLASEALKLQQQQQGKLLENVTVTAKTKSPVQVLDDKYTSALFKNGDGYQFDLVNDPTAVSQISIFNYLQGKVAGLQISTNGNTPSLTWRGGSPQLYLDETPVDPDLINSLPVGDIAYVKVFRPPFMGGFNGANGAIAIYTRKGNDQQTTPGKGLSNNVVAGYTQLRQFYVPNYQSFNKENEKPDLRTTLYWNPLLMPGARGKKVLVSFFNNDVSKAFRVVIEGVSKEGLLTHYEEVME